MKALGASKIDLEIVAPAVLPVVVAERRKALLVRNKCCQPVLVGDADPSARGLRGSFDSTARRVDQVVVVLLIQDFVENADRTFVKNEEIQRFRSFFAHDRAERKERDRGVAVVFDLI